RRTNPSNLLTDFNFSVLAIMPLKSARASAANTFCDSSTLTSIHTLNLVDSVAMAGCPLLAEFSANRAQIIARPKTKVTFMACSLKEVEECFWRVVDIVLSMSVERKIEKN